MGGFDHSLRQAIVVGFWEMNGAVHDSFAGHEVACNRAMCDCGVRLPGSNWSVAIRTFIALCLYVAMLTNSFDFP